MAATPANSLTLISSGLQDARLQPPRGNPDANQFLKVLRKTTRWAAQWNRVEFDGTPEFGQRVSVTLPRIGELASGFMVVVTLPDIYAVQAAARAAAGTNFLGPTYGWTNGVGHALIQQIELEIGGAIVETLDSRQLEILDELYETVESSIAKNRMIARAPNGFKADTWLSPTPLTVYVPIPFWWSRPQCYENALPLDALNADAVRVHVTFRSVAQLFYTDARVDTRTVGYRVSQDTPGGMWGIQGGRFWVKDLSASTMVYSMNAQTPAAGVPGKVLAGHTFPQRFTFVDAHVMVEYISLEEYEAIAFRSAELTYRVEQHLSLPVQATLGQKVARINLPFTNPTKELFWVLQRPEAENYNAWFLFTRDLAAVVPPQVGTLSPCNVPWWPDAQVLPTGANHWQIVPAFQTSYSEPLEGAELIYNSFERFVQEGGSFFRGLTAASGYAKSAVYDRYVYVYPFGERCGRGVSCEPTGAANWDKISRKELYITLNNSRLGAAPPNMNLYIYVTNWNVFKVFGGRGGMLFSN